MLWIPWRALFSCIFSMVMVLPSTAGMVKLAAMASRYQAGHMWGKAETHAVL